MRISLFAILISVCTISKAQTIPLYIGTYTGSDSEGIYRYDFNTETGEISNINLAAKSTNPSYLTYSSNREFIYAVAEVNNYNNTNSGSISAFSVAKDGTLNLLNTVSSNGAHPCHIELDGENVAISNYSGGTISLHKIEEDGSIMPAYQILNHNTSNKASHAHSAQFFKNELLIADLGRDFLAHYVKEGVKFILKDNYLFSHKSGPRHFKITKNGNFIYAINEYKSTVSVLKKSAENYIEIQNISTLDKDFKLENACADIHLSNDEKYLYGSNRGENSIVVFKRNLLDGTIKKIQSINVHGDWPRNFTFSPNGKFLVVANQKSKNLSVYKVSIKTGLLVYSHCIKVPTPVCLLF